MSAGVPLGDDAYRLQKAGVGSAFAAAAERYERHAQLQAEIAARLVQRLDYMKLAPASILDLGCGTGISTRLVARRYRRAKLVALDLAHGMLVAARDRQRIPWRRWQYVCADAEALPMAAASCELVLSNLMLQWCNDIDAVFRQILRVLQPGGLLLFSTFGPDTLKELRNCWRKIDDRVHVNAFADMHDVGDALIRAGFSSPVLDVEHLSVTYPDLRSLLADLKGVGSRNLSVGRHRGLTGKGRWRRLRQAYEAYRHNERLPATYEVVYGHAWAPHADTRPQDGSTVGAFPLAQLRGSRRRA